MDRDLVEAARKRDKAAYADLIRIRGDRLFALAQRILRDVDRAEDAVQNALVTAWRDLPGLRDPDRFDAWLHRLVVRSCLAEAKRERRRITNLHVLPIDLAMPGDDYLAVGDRDQLERGFRPQPRATSVARPPPLRRSGADRDRRGAGHPGRDRWLAPPHRPPRDARCAGRQCPGSRSRRTTGMTTRNDDIERVLELWLAEGPRHMSDRLFDGTFERIEHLPKRRLAGLLPRLPAMHLNVRLAVAAALVVALAGAGLYALNRTPSVRQQPTSAPTRSPAEVRAALQSWWSAVGDRASPGDWGPTDNTFQVDATGLAIEQLHGNVLSSWSLTDGSSRLVVTWEREVLGSVPSNQRWGCQVGDEGIYAVRLADDDGQLTLGLVSDPCAPRAVFLPGVWTRCLTLVGCVGDSTTAASPDGNAAASAAPEPNGERVEFPGFRPFGPGTTGTFSATVPIQRASQISTDSLQLVNPFGPRDPIGDSSIYVVSGIRPGGAPDPGSCAAPFAGPQRTPAALAAWIRSFASLEVTAPQPVTVGGLSGVVIDVTERPEASTACGVTTSDGQRIEILAGGSWLTRSSKLRLFLLDRGDGESILIDVGNRGQPTWESIDAAMPSVNAFVFTR
jgi:DNA-directed RNA polymerase specialized sigma24 family protein